MANHYLLMPNSESHIAFEEAVPLWGMIAFQAVMQLVDTASGFSGRSKDEDGHVSLLMIFCVHFALWTLCPLASLSQRSAGWLGGQALCEWVIFVRAWIAALHQDN